MPVSSYLLLVFVVSSFALSAFGSDQDRDKREVKGDEGAAYVRSVNLQKRP